MAVLAVGAGYVVAPLLAPGLRPVDTPAAAPAAPARPAAPSGATATLPASGDELVRRVLDNLERRPNVAAKIRQSTRLEDDTLAGSGVYWQQGVENLRRTYWRLQTVAGDQPASYTQVFTGDELWTDRRVRDERKVLRVDVKKVVRELNLADGPTGWSRPAREASASPAVLARGGLSQMVAELYRCFEFEAPQATRIDDVPVLAMIGRWRQEELAVAWPGLDAAGDWPKHLPHHVLLVVGTADLFPRLVEYRRGSQASLADAWTGQTLGPDPLARFEFFEVSFAASFPPGSFEFAANEINYRDATGRVIERLRARAKLAAKDRAVRE